MATSLTQELVNTWVNGWAAARNYATSQDGDLPVVHLGEDRGNGQEYFLLDPTEEHVRHAVQKLDGDPAGRITIVTNELANVYPLAEQFGLDVVRTEESLMVANMAFQDVEEPPMPWEEFSREVERSDSRAILRVLHEDKDIAHGSLALVDGTAVYDRVETSPDYRRRGLGSYVMRALSAIALEHDADAGIIIASADGRMLYQFLGWESVAAVATLKPRKA